jgi:hypothetical protein
MLDVEVLPMLIRNYTTQLEKYMCISISLRQSIVFGKINSQGSGNI